jgi:hypothetical protein
MTARAQVQAVLVYPSAKVEAKAEAQVQGPGRLNSILDEEVFVSQLLRRARILDDGFQATVLRAVEAFAIPTATCIAEKQMLIDDIGCENVIPVACHDETSTTSLFTTLVHLNQAGNTDTNAKVVQNTLAPPSVWSVGGGRAGGSSEGSGVSEGGQPRQPNLLPSKLSSGMLGECFDEQSSSSGSRWRKGSLASSGHDGVVTLECTFRSGPGQVDVQRAPVKTAGRIMEKLAEYAGKGVAWPLTGCILDPVRGSVVCAGPAEMIEVLGWFEGREQETGLKVVRVKNKFGFKKEDLVGSYRDLMVCVLYRAENGLAIIGEIQVASAIQPAKLFGPLIIMMWHGLISL